MPHYTAPTQDTLFLLQEVIGIDSLAHIPGYEMLDADMLSAIVEGTGKFCSDIVAPLNQPGDMQGCTRHSDGSVTVPDGYADAYKQFHADGWGSLAVPEAMGGQGLPELLSFVQQEYLTSGSQAFLMHAVGPLGTLEVLHHLGSDEMKAKYCPKLLTGEWSGTMNLTEPQAGSDVGLLRTKAISNPDGSYAITGDKIFISQGEHDITENIIHLVLARTPDAPAGTKGISLFLVPKVLINDDSSLGEKNSLICTSIEHKMGIHASSTCSMSFDGATGWLVGEENKGLACMFILMNSKRLECAIQGLGAAEVAYQNALEYAKERRQGRAVTGPIDPQASADPIIVHASVRRKLMDARSFIEAMRGMTLWCGSLIDVSQKSKDEAERKQAGGLVGLLIPILKAYGTDKGLQTTIDMQQIWGGYGYVTETGVDQFVRDVRVASIYEGTNGIQAMDLVKRKIMMAGGSIVQGFLDMVDAECEAANDHESLTNLAANMKAAKADMEAATKWLQDKDMTERSAGATYFLDLCGIVALGYMWLRIGQASVKGLESNPDRAAFYKSKIAAANYYAERFTPDTASLRRKIEVGSASLMDVSALG